MLYINEHPNIEQIQCDIVPYYEVAEAELDEMWSYVFSKENPRWLWPALDHHNRQILAYAFGRRKDEAFRSFWLLFKSPSFIQMTGVVMREIFLPAPMLL